MSNKDLTTWNPEDEQFWESTGKKIATRNLWISIPSLLVGFSVWLMWGIITVQMKNLGFTFGKSPEEAKALLFMLPATIAGSLAFMLPVATPPNAIVFGTKRLKVIDMSRTGFLLNIIGILIVTLTTYYLATYIFNIDIHVYPNWAK